MPATTTKKSAKKEAVKKVAKKAAPTKANKKGTKRSTKKESPKSKPIKQPAKDDARAVAKASKDRLDTNQVRILRALAKPGQKKELTRNDLKEAVGIGRDGKYSAKWLKSLWDLAEHGLIVTPQYEDERNYYHAITAKGKKVLNASEQEHKKSLA